jgi:hypothetical protein
MFPIAAMLALYTDDAAEKTSQIAALRRPSLEAAVSYLTGVLDPTRPNSVGNRYKTAVDDIAGYNAAFDSIDKKISSIAIYIPGLAIAAGTRRNPMEIGPRPTIAFGIMRTS